MGNVLVSQERGHARWSPRSRTLPAIRWPNGSCRALEAGLAAGGERSPVRSAAVVVAATVVCAGGSARRRRLRSRSPRCARCGTHIVRAWRSSSHRALDPELGARMSRPAQYRASDVFPHGGRARPAVRRGGAERSYVAAGSGPGRCRRCSSTCRTASGDCDRHRRLGAPSLVRRAAATRRAGRHPRQRRLRGRAGRRVPAAGAGGRLELLRWIAAQQWCTGRSA